jgi:ferredoxin
MSDPQTNIQVELLDTHGDVEWIFSPKPWQSFAEAANDAWLSIPTSCCSGACFVCACRITQWQEDVDIGLVSVPLVDMDRDQVLTCVGWLKDQIFSDWKFHKIVLQKLV